MISQQTIMQAAQLLGEAAKLLDVVQVKTTPASVGWAIFVAHAVENGGQSAHPTLARHNAKGA